MVQKSTTLEVHVQPGAKSDDIVGFRNGVLYLRVTAPPYKGQANRAALKLIRRILGVSKGSIEIIRGHTGRNKVLSIHGLGSNDLKKALVSYSEIG
jgi:uncharacterized protein (TIGR00251 family)